MSARFQAIADNFQSYEQVQNALRQNGLESSNLIVAVDFTKSNEWTGKHSFNGRSLHSLGPEPNPYEHAISIIAKTLEVFDDDGLIPGIGFGDSTTQDSSVFSFLPNNASARGLNELVARYRELVPHIRLAGPTSFAPAIYEAMKIVHNSAGQYHILLIVADGQVTRSSDMQHGQLSVQEQATVDAIVAASELPLSIVMVGVGDGPWDVMKEFDDNLPARRWDNFQFVNFTEIATRYGRDPQRMEAVFALNALMEIPEQYKIIQRLRLLGRSVPLRANVRCLQPPGPPPASYAPPPAQFGGNLMYPSFNARDQPGDWGSASAPPAPPLAAVPSHVDSLFMCPITQDTMTDPVMAADGYTYDRASITQWLETHNTSPMTNERMPHKNLTPNHALRSSIKESMERR